MGFRSPLNGIPPSAITADMLADGSVTGSKLSADAIDGKVITGATLRTAASGNRVEIYDDDPNGQGNVDFYTGTVGETEPGRVHVEMLGIAPALVITPPRVGAGNQGVVELLCSDGAGSPGEVLLTGDVSLDNVTIGNGRQLRAIDFGSFSGTADASGDLLVYHNLGNTPVAVNATPLHTTAGRMFSTHSLTPGEFKVRSFIDASTPVAAGQTISGRYIAVR